MINLPYEKIDGIRDSISDRESIINQYVKNEIDKLYQKNKVQNKSFLWFKWTKELTLEKFNVDYWLEITCINASNKIVFLNSLNKINNILQFAKENNIDVTLDDSQLANISALKEMKKGLV